MVCMLHIQIIGLLCFSTLLECARISRRPKIQHAPRTIDELDPEAYLERFGYLKKRKQGDENIQHSPKDRQEAIRKFQLMANIEPTGKLDEKTAKMMMVPRCGMPDIIPGTSSMDDIMMDPVTGGRNKVQNFYVPGYKWSKKTLTWKTAIYSRDLSEGAQRRAFYDAFKHWTDVTDLQIHEIGGGNPDIEIKFGSYYHGDSPGNEFDGEGGILAHAFFPEDGDTHFDEDETWTVDTERGTNLMIVAAHEFGHALGLGHSSTSTALMAPFYQGYDPNFKLHPDDISAIQSLYGKKVTVNPGPTVPPTERPKSTSKPDPNAVPDTCKMKYGAILQGPDNQIYILENKYIWKVDQYFGLDSKYPQRSKDVFPKLPSRISAAVYSWRTRYTYFFKGMKVFKYYSYRQISKKIIRDSNYPKNIQSALMGRDGRIYLFSGSTFWVFDESKMGLSSPESRPISAQWIGVPPNVEASVRLTDGYVYFFKGLKYRKYDEYQRKVLPGYPKLSAPSWMGPTCGGSGSPK